MNDVLLIKKIRLVGSALALLESFESFSNVEMHQCMFLARVPNNFIRIITNVLELYVSVSLCS